jgi:hypothetical protein
MLYANLQNRIVELVNTVNETDLDPENFNVQIDWRAHVAALSEQPELANLPENWATAEGAAGTSAGNAIPIDAAGWLRIYDAGGWVTAGPGGGNGSIH